mmetsp:Transcript_17584/g.40855  ORF Transcript_17584/g.40855 Transcript_17584/m.40855 type:complete len:93 (-) Transcript_17584:396-674(-)|eukprot:CAMPEP_0116825840 /NCGR_PEP_ID=MMETSP0418-20121206/2200_1 /TAXON_ID=1158023 /ORGANISM="Astrosyne radiata, Strain 13vi08-1A" /LENGTH=92 /DNA_ID=CAMNT_0004454415 /DNA_START=246 /DNA_END=524 /DNA_ORIENTATION=-
MGGDKKDNHPAAKHTGDENPSEERPEDEVENDHEGRADDEMPVERDQPYVHPSLDNRVVEVESDQEPMEEDFPDLDLEEEEYLPGLWDYPAQ